MFDLRDDPLHRFGLHLPSDYDHGGNSSFEGSFANIKIKIVVDSEKISGALRRVSLFSNPKNRLLRVDVKNEGMRVSAKSPELGEAFETLEILSANGEIDIGFDAQYIKDALAHIAPGEILLEFKDALSAVTLRPVESEDHLCLIMPMRLDA